MNTKNLIENRGLLAIIIGVAIFATAGLSGAYAISSSNQTQNQQPPQIQGSINLEQNILSNVQTKFSTAADTAASAVTNGKVIGGSLTVVQGYLVYNFRVIDDKNMVYSVIVDPANGKVLYTSQGHSMNFGWGHFGIKHSMNHSMKNRFHMGNSTTNTQPPTSYYVSPSSGSQV